MLLGISNKLAKCILLLFSFSRYIILSVQISFPRNLVFCFSMLFFEPWKIENICLFGIIIFFLLLRPSTWQRFSTDFYLTDQKSGLRATVKAGSGCKVIPLVVESKLVNTKRCRLLSPHLRKWLSERNLSTESRLLRLEEG